MIHLAALLAAAQAVAPISVPNSAPVYCIDYAGTAQPIQRMTYGEFTAAIRTQLGLDQVRLVRASSRTATLIFRGGQRGAETISYSVRPWRGSAGLGIALVSMRVRLSGATEDPVGDDMCWKTFGLVSPQ